MSDMNEGRQKCEKCTGNGFNVLKTGKNIVCDSCDGFGAVVVISETETKKVCRYCFGWGHSEYYNEDSGEYSTKDCGACESKGFITRNCRFFNH